MGIFSNFDNDANCVLAILQMTQTRKKRYLEKTIVKVPPGFEPGSQNSKS